MGKANNPVNNSKPREKVSALHVIMILLGSNLMLIMAPEFGLLNSFIYIPDLYVWPATVGGLAMVFFGFKGFFKKA